MRIESTGQLSLQKPQKDAAQSSIIEFSGKRS